MKDIHMILKTLTSLALVSILVASTSMTSKSQNMAQKPIQCFPVDFFRAEVKKLDLQLLAVSKDEDTIKMVLVSSNKNMLVAHLFNKKNIACIIDVIENYISDQELYENKNNRT